MAGNRKKYLIEFELKGGKLVSKQVTSTGKAFDKTAKSAKSANNALSGMAKLLPVAGVALMVKSFIKAADTAEQ